MVSVLEPSPPTNLVAKTLNSTAIKVTWQRPLHPNGEILYRVQYWQSSGELGKKSHVEPGLELTVAGLHEYVKYTFSVQACNSRYSSILVNVSERTHPAGKITVGLLGSSRSTTATSTETSLKIPDSGF